MSATLRLAARPLRPVYPGSPPETVAGLFRQARSSRLHLPAPLRSPGVTRLPRYYGCSDSRPVGLAPPAAERVSPRHVPRLPGSPSPTTTPLPRPLWHLPSASWASRSRGSGLHLRIAGSPDGTAESSSSSYGWPVRLGLLSTTSCEVAVTFGFRTVGSPGVDSHLPDRARLWTHDARASSPGMTGSGRGRSVTASMNACFRQGFVALATDRVVARSWLS